MKLVQRNKIDYSGIVGVQFLFLTFHQNNGQFILLWSREKGDWWCAKHHKKRHFLWRNKQPKGKGFEFFIGRLAVSFILA